MATATGTTETQPTATSIWWDRIDRWCERFGDKLNPILVKETRQALKSRQFVVTFSVLLFAAFSWTIIGSLMRMPQIYTTPSAQPLLIGYYFVLAIPLLLVVPLAAYRSLEGEIDDGTLELLSITTLSAWQIVLGKLANASLQMVLYFVALFPCFAYAYTLRGVDLPTTILIIGILIVAALLLTVVALFFSPLARTRTGRICTLLAVMGILLLAEWGIGVLVTAMILYGNPLPANYVAFFVIATVLIAAALSHFLLTATAAQLTPESENRSTPLRLSLLSLTGVVVGVGAYGVLAIDDEGGLVIMITLMMALAAIWTLCSSMFCAESSVMTPRIRRELPNSFLARLGLTWITPGPTTGLVFSVVGSVLLVVATLFAIEYVIANEPNAMRVAGRIRAYLTQLALLYCGYLVAFLVFVRLMVGVLRIKNNPRVEVGVAALVVVAVVFALVPYGIEMHYNDYRNFDYSIFQITNWAWTISEAAQERLTGNEEYIVAGAAAALFIISVLMMPATVLPRRIATPERVKEELASK